MFRRIRNRGLSNVYVRCKSSLLQVSAEVQTALSENKPVVALESTIVTHGMPHPNNYKTAINVQNIIREQGAIPATIAIVEGKVKVGLDDAELECLADPKTNAIKTSRRDIPYVISNKCNGGTTVSGTLYFANMAGIKVFVTGGIGGVHRNGEYTFDVSADLIELGRTPMMVVSSGVKSILDIGKTLEYLETQGVCVASYGHDKEFPGFYSSKSGFKAPYNLSTPCEAAKLLQTLKLAGLQSGILLGVPVPSESSIDLKKMDKIIKVALEEAEECGITGKDVTPFILKEVNHQTQGESLTSNMALIANNAKIGGQIAVELQKLLQKNSAKSYSSQTRFDDKTQVKKPVVIGGAVLDSTVVIEDNLKMDGRTLQGKILQCAGGVGRNLADALGKLMETPPLFMSAVGNDQYGLYLLESVKHVDIRGVIVHEGGRTACYSGLFDNTGECRLGVGDMCIHSRISSAQVMEYKNTLLESPLVVLDGNLPQETIETTLKLCSERSIPAWFEPTDISKAAKPFKTDLWKHLSFISPNLNELKEIAKSLCVTLTEDFHTCEINRLLQQLLHLAAPIVHHVPSVMITMGSLGLLMVSRMEFDKPVQFAIMDASDKIYARYYPPTKIDTVVNVSGAGDCAAAGFMAGVLQGLTEPDCVTLGQMSALDSLYSSSAVPHTFTHHDKLTESKFLKLQ